MPFYICIKPDFQDCFGDKDKIWASENEPDDYVTKENRSAWETRESALRCIASSDEMVIEEK